MDKARCGRVSCCYLLICSLLPPAYLHLPPALLTCPTLPCPIPPQPKPTPHPTPLHFQAWPPFWCQQWDSACTSPLPLSLSSSSSIRRHSISSLLLSLFLLLLLSFPQPAGPSSPTAAAAPAPAVQLGEQRGSTGEVATTPSVLKSTFFFSFLFFPLINIIVVLWSAFHPQAPHAWGTLDPALTHFHASVLTICVGFDSTITGFSAVSPSSVIQALQLLHLISFNFLLKSALSWLNAAKRCSLAECFNSK